MNSLLAVFTQAQTDCGAGDLAACRGDMQSVDDEVTRFQNVLAKNPAPPCLHEADAQLHSALAYYHNAATSIMRGIDNQYLPDVQAGGQLLDLGNAAFTTAASELNQAQC
ncbi:MAG TPA: hypothetical protein VFU88_19875 [Ktedonobacterales bacterium]|nr:hypothetical protein [Ktedonobacterales bacterium]